LKARKKGGPSSRRAASEALKKKEGGVLLHEGAWKGHDKKRKCYDKEVAERTEGTFSAGMGEKGKVPRLVCPPTSGSLRMTSGKKTN